MPEETETTATEATEVAEAEKKRLEAVAEKEAAVAKEVQVVLEGANMALQPFLQFSEHGIAPRVRLVENDMPKQPQNDGEKTDTAEAGGDSDEHESTDTEQS